VKVDVVIVGGGMVGACLALALDPTGLDTVLVETVPHDAAAQPSFDERTTALGNGSRRIFEALEVWPRIAAGSAAIRTIHVSDAGHFGFSRLHAQEQGVEAFGFVAPNRLIGAALWERLAGARNVALRVPAKVSNVSIGAQEVEVSVDSADHAAPETIHARLIVAADGARSAVREAAGITATVEDYDSHAIVANIVADRSHDGTAYERFTPTGPLAVLPMHDGSLTVVWTLSPVAAERVLQLDEAHFLSALQQCFGWRAGRFTRAGQRASYPLRLTRADSIVATRTVLIGNAAQSLHPVAGQGFNLGLRDAAMLAEVLAQSDGDPGSPERLSQFAKWRSADRSGVVGFTDRLVKLFGDTRPGVGVARNLGLLLFDLAPPAKDALARVSTGFAGPSPRLARGLGLTRS
jgi:2-octaprenyl-6-methoxyphenol hydroxylase